MFCCQDSCGFPAQCVSIPAHLLPFCRSNPNPVKGFGACCPQEGVYHARLAGTNQDQLSVTGSDVAIVQTAVRGKKKKKKRVSCWEAS